MVSIIQLQTSAKKITRRWRTIASILLFFCGVASVFWGTYHLVEITQVPICANPVDELQIPQQEDKQDDKLEENDVTSQASVVAGELGSIQVEIQGAIKNPGVYWLNYTSRLGELIELAGGLSESADKQQLAQQFTLSAKLKDEQKIKIPSKVEKELSELLAEYCQSEVEKSKTTEISTTTTQEESATAGIESAQNQECISINYASSSQLQTITGIGEKTAELIIEGRPYFKLSDLLEVKGIGEATLEKMEPFICL